MRLAIVFLLVVNFLLYLWRLAIPAEVQTEPTVTDTGYLRLVNPDDLPKTKAPLPEIAAINEITPIANENEESLPIQEPAEAVLISPPALFVERCYQLDRLLNEAERKALTDTLGKAGAQLSIKNQSNEVARGFWVMIPAQKDLTASQSVVEQLKAAGIKDLYLFTTGERENAVSLGYFSNKNNAIKRQKSVNGKGFNAVVQAKIEKKETSHLRLTTKQDEAETLKLLNRAKIDAKVQRISCSALSTPL